MRYFKKQRQPKHGLVICLYGTDSEGLLKYSKEWALKLPNVIAFDGLSSGQFQKVLRSLGVYVSPTLVDSYGIAVADACERTQGAYIFLGCRQDQFPEIFESAIKGELSVASKGVESGVKSLELFLRVY